MRRAAFFLLAILPGCVRHRSIEPLLSSCAAFSDRDPSVRAKAMKRFNAEYVWHSRTAMDEDKDRLEACVLAAARLFDDADSDTRFNARAITWNLISIVGARRADAVVPALTRDARRLLANEGLDSTESRLRELLLQEDVAMLGRYGAAAHASLSTIDAVLADPTFARIAAGEPPMRWRAERLIETAREAKARIEEATAPVVK